MLVFFFPGHWSWSAKKKSHFYETISHFSFAVFYFGGEEEGDFGKCRTFLVIWGNKMEEIREGIISYSWIKLVNIFCLFWFFLPMRWLLFLFISLTRWAFQDSKWKWGKWNWSLNGSFRGSRSRRLGRSHSRSLSRSLCRSLSRSLCRSLSRSHSRSLCWSLCRSPSRLLCRSLSR